MVDSKETQHAFATREDVCEGIEIPQTEKVITMCPSQLCIKDTASIKRSFSKCMIEYFITTQCPPIKKRNKVASCSGSDN